MRIEINAGGLGNDVAINGFQSDMSSFIASAEAVISSFKTIKNETYNLSGGVGSLQCSLDEINERIQKEEAKVFNAKTIQNKSNDFLELVARVDGQVSCLVNNNKDEFYKVNSWVKPIINTEEDTPWYEDAWNWLCGAKDAVVQGAKAIWTGIKDTVKKAWDGLVAFYNENKKIIDTILIVVGAIGAIVAVIATGGLAGAALVPLLTSIGISATVASVISATVAVVAVVSTVASGALNVFDIWCEIDNPTFNAWQNGLNIVSSVSNILYSIGGIYNSIKGYKMFSRIDWSGYPEGAKKPTGFYRVLDGEEYDIARKLANTTNSKLHRMNPDLSGLQIHEIHPVKFGGSPDNIVNKLFLTPEEHAKFTVFWNKFMRGL